MRPLLRTDAAKFRDVEFLVKLRVDELGES